MVQIFAKTTYAEYFKSVADTWDNVRNAASATAFTNFLVLNGTSGATCGISRCCLQFDTSSVPAVSEGYLFLTLDHDVGTPMTPMVGRFTLGSSYTDITNYARIKTGYEDALKHIGAFTDIGGGVWQSPNLAAYYESSSNYYLGIYCDRDKNNVSTPTGTFQKWFKKPNDATGKPYLSLVLPTSG